MLTIERLLTLAAAHPKAFIGIGRAMFTVAGVLAIIGLRLDIRIERLGRRLERVGAEQPDILAAWPWWLRMWIPEMTAGWAMLAAVAIIGFSMAKLGRWAQKHW